MAEAFKRENMMFNTDDTRYRSIQFSIRYNFEGEERFLYVIGYLWNKKLEIKQIYTLEHTGTDHPQFKNDLVELIIFFRDYFF